MAGLCVGANVAEAKGPSVLYLTWMHDPTTTMTVQWHTTSSDATTQVSYRRIGEKEWQMKEGIYALVPKNEPLYSYR